MGENVPSLRAIANRWELAYMLELPRKAAKKRNPQLKRGLGRKERLTCVGLPLPYIALVPVTT